ncbi:3-phosphoshikimate 1-carboxyvinyltransferase [Sedimentibacter saalensis]|uniref:3-phosphoshikimate 1-carboxyvinyltransferase n=1 Tax=Sedimentibacter saalensis TaxID=130788 RepID=A0A562JED2_9FIRM|nr:3-phosphoshikimate 1-carboxyvinyltransferase [Sedimentibacter saalensis]TWH81519.1 3-phosphoshikimate 1-carboxyvinyltransferase [Sedimentibacter saalensis]
MSAIKIKPAKLNGKIYAPPSKSMSHRALICAGLSSGESIVENVILSEDIKATMDSMKQLGAEIEVSGDGPYSTLCINGSKGNVSEAFINCRESGSTLRFLIPVGLMLADRCTFTGSGNLSKRPLDVFFEIFKRDSIDYETNDGQLPLWAKGNLKGGTYEMTGGVSSQFISGLLFALPLLRKDSTIKIKDNLESRGYVDLTINMLEKFGISVENQDYRELKINKECKYKNANYKVEGDYSQAAFFIVAREIGNDVDCLGLNVDSLQGDKEIVDIVRKYDSGMEQVTIDASQIPDLVPILTVLASLKDGVTTYITNAERLRIKESDRLKAISTELGKLGAIIEERKDGLIIKGKDVLDGGAVVDSWNDHRIAMSLAVAATRCREDIILTDCMAVNKSYPNFWEDYKMLGGEINEFNDRQ